MTSTEWFGLGVLVFVVACVWFTSMFRILIAQLDTIAAELRGINAKLGRIEDHQE
jgi:hypothetical protein